MQNRDLIELIFARLLVHILKMDFRRLSFLSASLRVVYKLET